MMDGLQVFLWERGRRRPLLLSLAIAGTLATSYCACDHQRLVFNDLNANSRRFRPIHREPAHVIADHIELYFVRSGRQSGQ